jgi:hypothetical protein
MSLKGRRAFSLLEAIIAVGMLACTVLAVTGMVSLAQGQTVRCAHEQQARQLVANAVEDLRSLPFLRSSPDLAAGQGGADLVGSVFPHARVSQNRDTAYYCPEGTAEWPAGSFISTCEESFGSLTMAATFVRSTPLGWVAVCEPLVCGFLAHQATELPAPALRVTVILAWNEAGRARHVSVTRVFTASALPCSSVTGQAAWR